MTPCPFHWLDLVTTDVPAAQAFYTAVIGWTLTPFEGGDRPYSMWTAPHGPVGGAIPLHLDIEAPPHWLAYLAVPDLRDVLARAEAAGARVLVPLTPISEEVGAFAVIADPQGAALGLVQPAGAAPEPEGAPRHGAFTWHELATADLEAAWSFHSGLFGWRVTSEMDMGPAGVYRLFGVGEQPLGGMFRKPAEMPSSAWLHYIYVDDLDGAVERVKAHGGRVIRGPMEIPGGDRVAHCIDPQGAMFALHGG